MKTLGGVTVVFVGLALLLGLLGQTALALTAIVLWLACAALIGIRTSVQRRAEDPAEELDADGRTLYAPIRRVVSQIEEVVQNHQDSAVMKVVGAESLQEAARIQSQVAQALTVRRELKRALRGKSVAALEIDKLAKESEQAAGEAKESLESAAEARRLEVAHYAEAEKGIQQIDAGVRAAYAALSELQARLAGKASGEKAETALNQDDLRETIGRLKSLSVSYEEAEQMLKR